MSLVFSMSDIHGHLKQLEEALLLVDLESNRDNMLILCGDYIDYGLDSCAVLNRVKKHVESYPSQIIVLMGNHEAMFLEFLDAKNDDVWSIEWLGSDKNFVTVNSFISEVSKEKISQLDIVGNYSDCLIRISKIIKTDILANHAELVEWLRGLPLYFETETQIYVHAGIDEEAEEFWKVGSSDEYFLSK